MLDFEFDNSFRTEKLRVICGTDEAGRGPLAGPVVAGACILPEGLILPGLDDSKKLTEKKREKLYEIITTDSRILWAVAEASPEEIDAMNILNASLLAMRRAIAKLPVTPDFVLVDGNMERGFPLPCRAVVGGDGISQSIAAASILAKVTRDRMCADFDRDYPEYGFAGHKGYPTPAHKLAVYRYGPCPLHRKSFLGFLEREQAKLQAMLEQAEASRE